MKTRGATTPFASRRRLLAALTRSPTFRRRSRALSALTSPVPPFVGGDEFVNAGVAIPGVSRPATVSATTRRLLMPASRLMRLTGPLRVEEPKGAETLTLPPRCPRPSSHSSCAFPLCLVNVHHASSPFARSVFTDQNPLPEFRARALLARVTRARDCPLWRCYAILVPSSTGARIQLTAWRSSRKHGQRLVAIDGVEVWCSNAF